jgi:DNA processing protein
VEGAQYSGSAITAKLASEYGRRVFAVPGNITSKMSWGPNLLIRQGATLVQDAADVMEGLPPEIRRQVLETRSGQAALSSEEEAMNSRNAALEAMGPNAPVAREILKRLHADRALHIDTLIDSVDTATPSEILAVLFDLELAGMVRQLPGRNFVKVW